MEFLEFFFYCSMWLVKYFLKEKFYTRVKNLMGKNFRGLYVVSLLHVHSYLFNILIQTCYCVVSDRDPALLFINRQTNRIKQVVSIFQILFLKKRRFDCLVNKHTPFSALFKYTSGKKFQPEEILR